MKITTLNNLKSNKIYKDISIISVNSKSNKDLLNNDCIILLSDSNNDIINILNNNLFKYSYYKNLFRFIRVRNNIKSTVEKSDIKSYYTEINSKINQKRIYKKSISDYNKKNLIIDTSNILEFFYRNSKSKKGLNKVNLYTDNIFDNIIKNINKSYYNNLVLLIPINTNEELSKSLNSYLNINSINNSNNSIQYIYHSIKNNIDNYLNRITELEISDITLLFYVPNTNLSFKVNISELKDKSKLNKTLINIKRLLNITIRGLDKSEELEFNSEEENDNNELSNKEEFIKNKIEKTEDVVSNIVNLVKSKSKLSNSLNNKELIDNKSILSNNSLTEKEMNIVDDMINKVSKVIDSDKDIINDDTRLIAKLNSDEEFLEYVKKLKDIQILGNSNVDIKKKEALKSKQDELTFDDNSKKTTLKSILTEDENISIEEEDVPVENKVIFDNLKKNKIKDFDDAYMKKNYKNDIMKTLMAFNNDEELPLFIDSIKIENTSTDLTLKNTYTILYKDTKNVKHTVTIDLPIIIDNNYIYVNGSKKLIQKQLISKPITKIAPDKVQIASDYNKYFITRFGSKLSEETEVIKKIVTNPDVSKYIANDRNFGFKLGDISGSNIGNKVNIYYSHLSNVLFSIYSDKYIIEFDYFKLINLTEKENNISYDSKLAKLNDYDKDKYHIAGYYRDKSALILIERENNNVIRYSKENEINYVRLGINLNEFILLNMIRYNFTEEGVNYIKNISRPKSLVYNRMKISGKDIPLIIILGYQYGLLPVLERYGMEYVFTSTNKKSDIISGMTMKIRFKNGYLYYDSSRVRNSLLLSGLNMLPTEDYDIKDFEKLGEPYIDYFSDAFGSRNTGKGITNNLNLFLDPKTKTILEKLNLPTNMLDILLYANSLLESNDYKNNNDMNNFRLRGTEQVNAILYKLLADAYRKYKDTSKNGNPIKVSLQQDILLKKLVENQTVDEASDLNPSLELEKISSVTYKGVGGVNSDRDSIITIYGK